MDEELREAVLAIMLMDIDALDEPKWKKEKLKTIAKHLLETPEGLEQLKKLKILLPAH